MLPRALGGGPFRLLFAGQAVSSLGDRIAPVALAFGILEVGSVSDLGIVMAARTLPLVTLVLLGGVWGDRIPRQLVMLASDAVRCTAQALSAVLLLSGESHVWQIAALQAVYGAAQAFFGPASTALVPETVPAEDLQQANALLGLTDNAASVLGPALAGVTVAILNPGWGLALDAATFIVSAAFLALIRVERAAAPASRHSTISELKDGWRAFSSRSWLWLSVLFFTLYIALVYSPFQVLGPEVAKTALGGPGAWAAISAMLGVGALAGGALGLRWRPRHPLRVGFLSFLLAGPGLLAALAAHAPLALILPLALVDGISGSLFNALWYTAQQTDVPAEELSRVSSWDYLGTLALHPLGLAASGPIAALIGVSSALYGAAGLILVLGLGILAVPSVRNFTPGPNASSSINRVNT